MSIVQIPGISQILKNVNTLSKNFILSNSKSDDAKYNNDRYIVQHIPLADIIKKLDKFITEGVDLYDHTKVFL